MKFANKYELFEPVTSGRVETFFAKDLASGERVLLHIFEAPEKKPDQPTVQWVLESFSKVAPSPPGLVVETGRYSGTTYAYLVTKLPDSAALQRWTQTYESSTLETQEIAIPSEGSSLNSLPVGKDRSRPNDQSAEESNSVRSATPLGDFTAAFSGLASPVSPRSEGNTTKTDRDEINLGPEPTAPSQGPGDFTREFFSGPHQSPQAQANQSPPKRPAPSDRPVRGISTGSRDAAKAKGTESPRKSSSGEGSIPPADPGSFTALFQSSFKSETGAPSGSVGTPSKSDDANAGDFTDFFRGPFDREQPAETPIILPKPLDPSQRNATGEFTKVFGSGKDAPFATRPLQEPSGGAPQEPGSFTQLFPEVSQPAAPSATNAPVQTWEPIAPKKEMMAPSKEPVWTPPVQSPPKPPFIPSVEPILPKPAVTRTLREAGPALPDGATHVFSAPGSPSSSPPPLPAGPSEYTRIIAGGCINPTGAPVATGSQNPLPPPPKIAAPPPPKFSPPAPKAPQPEVKPPKAKASYLPLVIILNVLLFFAILLIVYFAVKH